MVVETEHDDATWYECEACGLLFDAKADARQHEANCDAEEPTYIQ
jgi:rubredoxin